MTHLEHCSDPVPARWVVESGTPFDQLVMFGPSGFPASARLRYIPDPTGPGQEEADVELSADHPSDLSQAGSALHRLEAFTSTPDECYFCVWEGYSDLVLPQEVTEASLVILPHRRYALFRGPLQGIDTFAAQLGSHDSVAPPAFVWPADHRWCFASDVDPHWAGIGAEATAVAALVADRELDVVPAEPGERQPLYY